eukprot:NODE_17955_length_918_cov_5.193426.p1 GENE.NODE_17955_length_918_cov_5.193426~~NODE_17955_length_918_cov_5.193426.p1  ORF type:complete len:291 (+),score=76.66 NODE_17955_length_918_cov_5.193426:26-874(+)
MPFDCGSTYRTGARFAPSAVRQASQLLRPWNPYLDVRPMHDVQVADCGDVSMNIFKLTQALETMTAETASILQRTRAKRVLIIGGDHTVSLAALRAVKAVHGPVALVHFGAHLDTFASYAEEPYTQSSPFRRAFEEGLLLEDRNIHIGARGPLHSVKDLLDDACFGFRIIRSEDLLMHGVDKAVERVLRRVGDVPTYVSVDMGVLDPAHAPGVSIPEPGGITSRELFMILRALLCCNIVAADIVEVVPAYDHAELTTITASSVGFELLSLMAKPLAQKRKGS